MMDDLKDAGMWIEWANELKKDSPDVAKFLITSANDRLERSFPETRDMLWNMMKEDKTMLKELTNDHINSWANEMKEKMTKLKKKYISSNGLFFLFPIFKLLRYTFCYDMLTNTYCISFIICNYFVIPFFNQRNHISFLCFTIRALTPTCRAP